VVGAVVRIAPWNAGNVTNANGRYTIFVSTARPGDNATITVQSVGYNQETQQVRISGDTVRRTSNCDHRLSRWRSWSSPVRPGQANRKVVAGMLAYSAAAAPPLRAGDRIWRRSDPRDFNTESYAAIEENPFLAVTTNPLSTFSIDVDRASSRTCVASSETEAAAQDAVRIEEMVNYFTYDDPAPRGSTPFAVRTGSRRPGGQRTILRIALKAREIEWQPAAEQSGFPHRCVRFHDSARQAAVAEASLCAACE
jgi:Ca-activated chloride channel family protein